MLLERTIYIEIAGVEFEVLVDFDYRKGRKAVISQAWENSSPEESDEIEIIRLRTRVSPKSIIDFSAFLDNDEFSNEIEELVWSKLSEEDIEWE